MAESELPAEAKNYGFSSLADGPSYPKAAEINRMKKDELVLQLRKLHLSGSGNKQQLTTRLKKHLRKRRSFEKTLQQHKHQKSISRYFDYICVIDFECTCVEEVTEEYPHEIIEFPAVLLDTATKRVVDEFRAYCKPSINPILSSFCSELTGITQEQVDNAEPFTTVFADFIKFLDRHDLRDSHRYAFLSDGPWDFGKFLQLQCQHLEIPIPHEMRHWINIRRAYCNFYKQQRTNLHNMMSERGLTFVGRMHCGLDDTRNIAKLTLHLIEKGCELRINERLLRRDRLKKAKKESPERSPSSQLNLPQPTAESEKSVEPENQQNVHQPEETSAILSEQEIIRRRYQFFLPYKVVSVFKQEFIRGMHLECMTCSESDTDEEC